MKNIFLYLVPIIVLLSCINEKRENNNIVFHNNKIDKNCVLIDSFDFFLKRICDDSKIFSKVDDNCVFTFVDKVSLLSKEDSKFFFYLNDLCKCSDGYLSSYMGDVSRDHFYTNFINYIIFLSNNKECIFLKNILIESLSMDASVIGKDEVNNIRDYIKKEMLTHEFQLAEKNFLKNLQEEIDPSMFD